MKPIATINLNVLHSSEDAEQMREMLQSAGYVVVFVVGGGNAPAVTVSREAPAPQRERLALEFAKALIMGPTPLNCAETITEGLRLADALIEKLNG